MGICSKRMDKQESSFQRGSVLIVSLILLLVMTLLGLTAMQGSLMEEMMAGHAKDQNLAFQSAEAALRGAEATVASYIAEPTPTLDGATGVWVQNAPDLVTSNGVSWWCETGCDGTWWTSNGVAYAHKSDLIGTSTPYSVVEVDDFVKDSLNIGQQHDEGGKLFYRVTARGTGGTDQALSLLRSSFARRY